MEESGDWDVGSELFSRDREGEAWDGEEVWTRDEKELSDHKPVCIWVNVEDKK